MNAAALRVGSSTSGSGGRVFGIVEPVQGVMETGEMDFGMLGLVSFLSRVFRRLVN